MKAKDITLTPLDLIKSLGDFDLDPCGFKGHKTAKNIFLLPEKDGLKDKWFGQVWMNPPYSEVIKWIKKMSEHNNGIALVLASTETRWFQEYIFKRASGILFLEKRPKFMNSNYEKVALMRGVVLVSYGKECLDKLRTCNLKGKIIELKSDFIDSCKYLNEECGYINIEDDEDYAEEEIINLAKQKKQDALSVRGEKDE